jgi:serine/threonine-protein kinase HipA
MTSPLRLDVHFAPTLDESRLVGALALDAGRPAFQYAPEWLRNPLPLAPVTLPPLSTVVYGSEQMPDRLHGLFADALPDAWGRALADRHFKSIGRAREAVSVLDRLAFVGTRGMGALTFRPSVDAPTAAAPIDLDQWSDQAAQVISGSSDEVLSALIAAAGSSGGARPKVLVALDGHDGMRSHDDPLRPGFTAWLVKLRYAADGPDAAATEFAYHGMARRAGIRVPNARILPSARDRYFAVERFDRRGERRVHMLTVSGLTDIPMSYFATDYGEIGRLIARVCQSYAESAEFARRMVFNVLARNRDDHLKNTTLLMDDAGEWTLSPAYDLTFNAGSGGEHSMLVAGEGRAPTRAHLIKAGEAMGVERHRMRDIIDEVRAAIAAWDSIADEAGVTTARRDEIARALAFTL